jgi:hypothetical protein
MVFAKNDALPNIIFIDIQSTVNSDTLCRNMPLHLYTESGFIAGEGIVKLIIFHAMQT